MIIPLKIEYVGEIKLGMETEVRTTDVPDYTGEYTYTPTTETQTVQIRDQKATGNITINPIPNNYGLITYNGTTIRVS